MYDQSAKGWVSILMSIETVHLAPHGMEPVLAQFIVTEHAGETLE